MGFLESSRARTVVVALIAVVSGLLSAVATTAGAAGADPSGGSATAIGGYLLVGAAGSVYSMGGAPDEGSLAGMTLAAPVVSAAATPDGAGYWLVGSDGGVFAFGDATYDGSLPGLPAAVQPHSPVVALVPTADGGGYWEVTASGGVYAFGDAPFYGSAGTVRLASAIVSAVATPSGNGYWLVAGDGGVFAYGQATFAGSLPGLPASARVGQRVVALVPTGSGAGYWEITAAGGVYSFGDAPFYGSAGATPLSAPVVDAAASPGGNGYWLATGAGQVLPFGDAAAYGGLSAVPAAPVVAIVPTVSQVSGILSSLPAPSATTVVITTRALPSGVVGSPYTATLSAAGGTAPYTWTVAGGSLPAGLSLTSGGTITGTPTGAGASSLTVEVADSSNPTPFTDYAELAITIGTSGSAVQASSNWAGYVDQGGPFTRVAGTFTVPTAPAGSEGSIAAEWVGIDGFTDDTQPTPLQAGVLEGYVCDPTCGVVAVSWYETPSTDGPVPMAVVSPGDTVSVDITQTGAGTWTVDVDDLTQQVDTSVPQVAYQGPQNSAEWVVEAPLLGYTAQGVPVFSPLPAFAPPVTFTGLGATGSVASTVPLLMEDPYGGLATPSTLDANGFAVASGAGAPAAP